MRHMVTQCSAAFATTSAEQLSLSTVLTSSTCGGNVPGVCAQTDSIDRVDVRHQRRIDAGCGAPHPAAGQSLACLWRAVQSDRAAGVIAVPCGPMHRQSCKA